MLSVYISWKEEEQEGLIYTVQSYAGALNLVTKERYKIS